VEEVVDPLRDKLEAAKRISKLQTTQQLALKFKIELPNNQINDFDNNHTIQCNINNNNSFDVNINSVSEVDEQNNTKYELMQRFLSSSTTHPNEQHKHHINDSIDREINDILSQLPPIHSNDLDLDSTQSQLFDHSNHSNQSFDYEFENSITNSNNSNNNSNNNNEINVNNSSDNEINDFTDGLENDSVLEDNRDINIRHSSVSEAHVEKLNEEKWEYVNGTYDSETEWREWTQMTSAVSYNGDILHILPYVDNNW
jgi:hypothetical protein